jgi:hypothetical protein
VYPNLQKIHGARAFRGAVKAAAMGKTALTEPGPDPGSRTETDPLSAAENSLLSGWIRPAVGEIPVAFGPLDAEPLLEGDVRIHLTFLGTLPATPPRALSRQPQSLLMIARYLVTASAPSPAAADRLIVALGFAALDRGLPELERDGPAPDLWLALGVTARPALVVREVLERQRPAPSVPLVRRPLVTEWSHSRTLTGRVNGPRETPIAGARIEVASAGLTAYSDHRGEFSLPGVPAGPPAPLLVITAKGVRLTVRADAPASEPLVITVPLPES